MTGEHAPVQIHFDGPTAPDMAVLNTTLIPFARLSDAQLASVLPVCTIGLFKETPPQRLWLWRRGDALSTKLRSRSAP